MREDDGGTSSPVTSRFERDEPIRTIPQPLPREHYEARGLADPSSPVTHPGGEVEPLSGNERMQGFMQLLREIFQSIFNAQPQQPGGPATPGTEGPEQTAPEAHVVQKEVAASKPAAKRPAMGGGP